MTDRGAGRGKNGRPVDGNRRGGNRRLDGAEERARNRYEPPAK